MLEPLDALLFKGDAEPATRAVMTAALVLERTPDAARLSAAFERATRLVPRLRQRVTAPLLPFRTAEWVTDESFDLDYHLRRTAVAGDRSLRTAIQTASAVSTAPLDPARPLWEATLVEGLEDGRAVLLLRAHHALADGVRALDMLAGLLDLEPDPPEHLVPALPPTSSSGSLGSLARTLLGAPWSLVQATPRRATRLADAALRATLTPAEAVDGAAGYLQSLTRLVDSGGATSSPLLRGRSRHRQFAALEVPLSGLSAAARAAGCTVNDGFLAGLLGGMRRYHDELGAPSGDIPLALPIDLSAGRPGVAGNRFSAAVIPGPASALDPRERMRQVHGLVAARRAERGLDVVDRIAPLLRQLPARWAVSGLAAHARRVDVQASNLVGVDCPTYLAGTRVERVHAFGPLPGVPLMVVLLSYDGTCSLGFTIDPAAVTEPALLVDCVRTSFDELMTGHAKATVAIAA